MHSAALAKTSQWGLAAVPARQNQTKGSFHGWGRGGRLPSTAWFMRCRMLCACRRFGSADSAVDVPPGPCTSQGAGAAFMPTKDCSRIAVLWSIVAAE
jgi:hypothetical protein